MKYTTRDFPIGTKYIYISRHSVDHSKVFKVVGYGQGLSEKLLMYDKDSHMGHQVSDCIPYQDGQIYFPDGLENQIDIVKTLIGRYFKNRYTGVISKIMGLSVYIKGDRPKGVGKGNSTVNNLMEEQGFAIFLDSYCEDKDDRYHYPIGVGASITMYEKPIVKVNNYEAKDCGDYYEFGCAKISKNRLKRAYDYLLREPLIDNNSNRKVNSIKIGEGEFTLEILKLLVEE